MDLPAYYTALYCLVYKSDGTPVGSGLCVDGIHIITCAHVVNSALNRGVQDTAFPSGTVDISFPFNNDVPYIKFTVGLKILCCD